VTSTRVRQATVSDAAGIAAVHVRSWQGGYRGLLPDALLDGLSIPARTRDWTDWLDAAGDAGFTLVGQADGHTVGFCSVATPARHPEAGLRTAEIAALYVDPGSWRAGVGRALLSDALERLRRRGCERVTLWVFERNVRARDFYATFGFVPDGASKRDEPAGPVQLRLVWRLGGAGLAAA
jgi:GNAT superfamily N-acetyltransferase